MPARASPIRRGVLLDGALFAADGGADTVLIAITGIHGLSAMPLRSAKNFTDGDPSGFLHTINSHMPTAAENRLLFIERTGHAYQQKHQEVADKILQLIRDWQEVAKQQIAYSVSSVCDFILI